MYKWPEDTAETTEQLKRFKSSDDISHKISKGLERRSRLQFYQEVEDEPREDEEDSLNSQISWSVNGQDDSPQTAFSFEDVPVEYEFNFNTCDEELEDVDDGRGRRKSGGRGRGKRMSPSVAFSLVSLSDEISTPAAFFVSESSCSPRGPKPTPPRPPQSSSSPSLSIAERLTLSTPQFYSRVMSTDPSSDEVRTFLQEEGTLRRIRSNVETSLPRNLPFKASSSGPSIGENQKNKKTASLANLKKQNACTNMLDLLSKEQIVKLREDKQLKALWGKSTSVDKVKKEFKGLKGIP